MCQRARSEACQQPSGARNLGEGGCELQHGLPLRRAHFALQHDMQACLCLRSPVRVASSCSHSQVALPFCPLHWPNNSLRISEADTP